MDRCELFQALLLEYLYDLLEGHERQSLETHLTECAGCRAALETAKAQQRLLATAAKTEFAAVRFQAPAASEPAPATIPMPVRRARPSLRRWALAAGVLLAIGVGGAGLWMNRDYAATAGKVEGHRLAEADIKRQIEQTDRERRDLPHQAAVKQNEIIRKINEQQIRVLVTGPQTLQAGARNEYRIAIVNFNGQPTPTPLQASILDPSGKELFKKDLAAAAEQQLVLPPDLPVAPNKQVRLKIVAKKEQGALAELSQQLDLVAPVYVTHLATDKPMYQPGETVHFRSLTLERFGLKPPEENLNLVYTLVQPSGAQVQLGQGSALVNNAQNQQIVGPDKKPVRGIGAGDFPIEPNAPGGEYTLRVSELANRFPPQERKFLVNRYQAHKLDKKLDFSKKTYGAGEDVSAACEAKRAGGGGEVAKRPVHAMVKIDGTQFGPDGKPSNQPFHFKTDAKGKVAVRFKLPTGIKTGLGTVSVTFEDGANTETLVKPIPIVLKKLDVQFFPEGGDLVAGVENRVYFQVRNTLGKPADLKGHIVDADKRTVLDKVETLTDAEQPGVNQGLGIFAFTPKADGKYELKIDSPAGMEGVYALPKVEADGVVLTIPKGVTTAKQPITALVRSAHKDRTLLVGAYCRGRLLDHKTVEAKKGEETKVELTPTVGTGGVYRVTVFEGRGDKKQRRLVPVAERLVYRQPAEQLLITAKPDKNLYVPGDKVSVKFSALTEQEKAAPAILMVAVVDKSIVAMADEKTHRSMPTHFLMTSEVKKPEDLEYADFLIGAHPKAKAALDLLLGTQGWRRFAEQDPSKFHKKEADEADRLLASIGVSDRPRDLEMQQLQNVIDEMTKKNTQLETELRDANERLANNRGDAAFLAMLHKLQRYDTWIQTGREVAIPIVCLLLLVVALSTLIAGLMRKASRAIPLFLASAACGVVVCVLFMHYAAEKMAPPQVAADIATLKRNAAQAARPMAAAKDGARKDDGDAPKEDRLGEQLGVDRFGDMAGDRAKMEAPPQPAPAEGAVNLAVPPRAAAFPAPVQAQPKALEKADKEQKKLGDKDKDGKDLNVKLNAAIRDRGEAKREPAKEAKKPAGPIAGGAAMPARGFGNNQGNNNGNNQGGLGGGGLGGFGKGGPGQPGGIGGFGGGQRAAGGMMPAVPPPPAAGMKAGLERMPALEQQFRRIQNAQMGGRRDLRLMATYEASIALPPLVVREYAHFRTHGANAEQRNDTTETVYWNPVVVMPDGKGEATFDLSDQVTSFEVTAYGHTLDGRLGTLTSTIESRIPLALEAKTPIEVTANDTIDLPLAVANNTDKAQAIQINAAFEGLTLDGKPQDRLQIGPDGRTRRIYRLKPSIVEGEAAVQFNGEAKPLAADSVRRSFRVVPDGFPIVASRSDLLEKSATNEIVLPDTWIKGTLKMNVAVYPSTLADLQKGLDALLREPNGCFEQTSTTNYPNLLILDYLKESDQAKPELEKRARDLLTRGYQKLLAFECPKTAEKNRQGFEWFGSPDQQHEALTAYGLLQFRDLSRVMDVDPKLIQRTRNYLMSARNGKGGFSRNARALDTFGRAPENITNAYIIWAITSSGKDDDVTTELNVLSGQAKDSKDPYFLALVANSLINRGKSGDATELLKKLAAAQLADGHLDAQQTSITGSAGRDLQIETTALSVLAWLKGNPGEFNPQVRKAITWIGKQRGGYGGFGSTQSTILALKALIEHAKANKKTPEAGTLTLYVADKPIGKLDFPADARDALEIKLPNAEQVLKPGKNTVRLEITGQNAFPYSLAWSYQTLKPASDPDCPVHLTTKLDRAAANEGETVTLNVTVENPSDAERSMVVAIIGLPAGLTLPEDMKQLKEHARLRDDGKKPGLISYFETRGRELILYWRGMGPKQKIELPVELICRVPGQYRGPASRAYMYYNADHKHWVEPLAVKIAAKSE